jgi:hypothetical protein
LRSAPWRTQPVTATLCDGSLADEASTGMEACGGKIRRYPANLLRRKTIPGEIS